MRKTLLALCLTIAPTLFAQSADVKILSMTLSGAPASPGERFAVAMRWRNDGPSQATFVNVSITGTPTPFYILSVATSGWPCYPNPEGTSFLCQNAKLDAGAEAEIVLQMLTPPTAGSFVLRGAISARENDPNPNNNVSQLTMNLVAGARADLSISPSTQVHRMPQGTTVHVPFVLANNGPDDVSNLTAVFTVPVNSSIPQFTADGEGWSCGHPAYGPQAIVCTRSRLRSGVVAPITLTTTAGAAPITFNARVRGEGHLDPNLANDTATATIGAEETQAQNEWRRILLPLTGGDVPGANGALWRTETTFLIESQTRLDLEPHGCTLPVTCIPFETPLRKPFTTTNGLRGGALQGEFIWVRAEDESKLRLNSRVYDVSRTTQTAGSEIPIAREDDFVTGSASIVGIPVAPHYRHTLRIFDSEGHDGAEVVVRLYANDETTPRATFTRTLEAPGVDTAPYPTHAAFAQLELGQVMSLAGINTVRVDVQPADPALRFWAFVSVTNNETHHVTTFSAQ